MPILHLLRHAKSSWDDPKLRDHDRPLAPRGERAAAAMAAHFRRDRIAPQLVLCSTARRTMDTLSAVRPALPRETAVETTADLYEATARQLLERLHDVAPGTGAVLVIGHNPGLEDLAGGLAGPDSSGAALAALMRKYPTCALATLAFDDEWAELSWKSARLTGFVTPKDVS